MVGTGRDLSFDLEALIPHKYKHNIQIKQILP